jgi:3-hydroxybutyrate dehydrogenase
MFYETGPATVEAMQLEGGLDALAGIYAAGSAIKRPNTVHEVAAVALMLARDEAKNITACLFPCDGGAMPY